MQLNEAQLYDLYNNSGPSPDSIKRTVQHLINLNMALHLIRDHKLGVREVSKLTGLKMVDIKAYVANKATV